MSNDFKTLWAELVALGHDENPAAESRRLELLREITGPIVQQAIIATSEQFTLAGRANEIPEKCRIKSLETFVAEAKAPSVKVGFTAK